MKGPSEIRTKAVHEKCVDVGVVIWESSVSSAVPGSADPNEWNRTLGQRGANIGSYGFDRPCLASQLRDRDPPVARKRRQPHRDRHKDYGRCATPALYPDAPKALVAASELDLRQRVFDGTVQIAAANIESDTDVAAALFPIDVICAVANVQFRQLGK